MTSCCTFSGEKLVDLRDNLKEMFDDVIGIASTNYAPEDKCRLSIGHTDLASDVFIHLQNLENLDGQSILNRFEKVLNSHESMSADETFEISVGLLRSDKGGGPPLPLLPHLTAKNVHSSVVNKKAIVNILPEENMEQLCAAKSLKVCEAKLDGWRRDSYLNLIRKNRQHYMGENGLKYLALQLQAKTGLPVGKPVTVAQLALFEPHVKAKIFVIQFLQGMTHPVVTPCSQNVYERQIYLYLFEDHYYPVVNVDAMFPNHQLCKQCHELYSFKDDHPCSPRSCLVCNRKDCLPGVTIKCTECNMNCRNQECFEAHLKSGGRIKKSKCELNKKCQRCGKVVNTRKVSLSDHECGKFQCRLCLNWVDPSHLCYLRRKSMKSTSGRFIFFDFESTQSEKYECTDGYSPIDTTGKGCGKPFDPEGQQCDQSNLCQRCRLCRNCK